MSADRGVTGRNASRDWIVWLRSYDDPESSLTRRLDVVRRRIGETLDNAGAAPVRILSLCAGDGRDVLAELAARPALQASAVLVEQDVRLVEQARAQAAELGDVDVRRGDAGDPATFVDVLPVDLLLLCGIFGNVSDDDIRTTVAAVPAMLAAGGIVIWTRGVFDDRDLRPRSGSGSSTRG